MFTEKTTVRRTTGKMSGKISKSVDDLMAKGSEMLDAGMKVMDEAFDEAFKGETLSEAVTTTIRIRLTTDQIDDLRVSRTLTCKAEGVTILLEKEPL